MNNKIKSDADVLNYLHYEKKEEPIDDRKDYIAKWIQAHPDYKKQPKARQASQEDYQRHE